MTRAVVKTEFSVRGILERKKVEYRIFYTRYSGHAGVIVRKNLKNMDFVTVFGGDGTIREVVKGMGDHPLPVGIIPCGTVNVLALDLGISLNPVIATVTIVEGYQRKIDIGYLNDEPFLLMVSTGIDALAVHNVDLMAKRIFGQIAYVISAL
ncbi:Diacylglycerol kinase [subsurface metagenome]